MLTRVKKYLFELVAPRRFRRMVNRVLYDAAAADHREREDKQEWAEEKQKLRNLFYPGTVSH